MERLQESGRIDVAALQDGGALPKEANWTSVTLTSRSLPDEVMAVAASYDDTLRYGAQTPFSDQLAFKWEGGMWEVDAQHDSIITAGNGGTKPTHAAFTIYYNQGAQRYDLEQSLQPDEQMWIDVGKLIREHVPDKNGKALPVDLAMGSFEIRDLTNRGVGTLFEGKITYDKTYGHAAYGCSACCGYRNVILAFNPLGIPFLSSADNFVYAKDVCANLVTDVSDSFYFNWTTAQPSTARVDAFGKHTGASMGSTTSTTYGYVQNQDVSHQCPISEHFPSGADNVVPTINSISPAQGPVGMKIDVAISGNGFGTTPTVNAGTGITVTVNNASNTQIQASFTISTSASSGNRSITVTAGGQTSTGVNFFVQVPTSLQLVAGTSITTAMPNCTVVINGNPYSAAGCRRTLRWQVMDQQTPTPQPIQTANMSATDSFTNAGGTNSCFFPATGGNTGTGFTDSSGQFPDTYTTCSTSCLNGGTCKSTELQTWNISGTVLTSNVKTVVYTCSTITINGQ